MAGKISHNASHNAEQNAPENTQFMRLAHVNAAPSQTWNWLRMNECEVDVDALPGVDSGEGLLEAARVHVAPNWQGFLCGAGAQAGAWVDLVADVREELTLADGDVCVVVLGEGAGGGQGTQGAQGAKDAIHGTKAQLMLEVAPNAHATLTVIATGSELTATNIRVHVAQGASLTYQHCCAKEGAHARHVEGFSASVEADAHLAAEAFVLGADFVGAGSHVELLGQDASFEQDVRYIVDARQTADLTSTCIHFGERTESEIVATGVLGAGASKTLRATIDLVRGCKGANASETETVVCEGSSESVTNKTLPVILCSEDDVQGNHGATIGSLSPQQLFYLASRGVNPKSAVDLLKSSVLDATALALPASAKPALKAWAAQHVPSWEGDAHAE